MFDGCWREHIDGYFHVLEAGHWSAEVEVFVVKAHVSGARCADDAVPQQFGGCEICGVSGEIACIVNEVATCCQSDSVGIRFLWAVVNNDSCVRDGAVAWNLFDLVVCVHEDTVGAWCVGGCITLGKVSEFFAEGPRPSAA